MNAPEDHNRAEEIRQIRANAELVVNALAGETDFPFGFDAASVEWLNGYIDRIRANEWTEEETDQLVNNLGAYLGEAIIAAYGGGWVRDQYSWAICWDERNCAYPFAKVFKHLKNGPEDSIYSFYTTIAALRAR